MARAVSQRSPHHLGGDLGGRAFGSEPDGRPAPWDAGRVTVRGDLGARGEAVVPAPVVGPVVGEERFPLLRVEGTEHSGGHDDAVRPAGQGVGVRSRRVDDTEVAAVARRSASAVAARNTRV